MGFAETRSTLPGRGGVIRVGDPASMAGSSIGELEIVNDMCSTAKTASRKILARSGLISALSSVATLVLAGIAWR